MAESQSRGEHANNSFYTAFHLVSGFIFGAMEYDAMTASGLRVDIVVLFLLALLPPFYLCAKKRKLEGQEVRLFALTRPYYHIVADFLFAISTVSMFSLLAYMITKGLPLTDIHFDLSIYGGLLLMNTICFLIAIFLYSMLAQDERRAIGGSS